MASPTLTRLRPERRPGETGRASTAARLARVAFVLLCAAFAVGFLVFPTFPNYDSYYSLLWGREVLDGTSPFFEGFRVPTEHPLAIAVGAVLSLLGDEADRVWIAMTLVAFLSLVWGVYRLGRVAFTPLVGLVAAALLVTRFDFGFLAARGYIDVPYMALVVWAAVLEAQRTRRGAPVFVLLALAGMLRPEAWLLAGLYFLWMVLGARTWGERVRWAALAAIGPLTWCAVDYAVTGDPLFSLTYTSSSAEDLGRQRTLSEIPTAVPYFLSSLVKLPVWLAALVGIVIAAVASPRRTVMPFVLLVCGLGTFGLIGVAGLSVIERYLIVAALALLVFAAVTLAGWTMLEPGRLRTAWMAGAVLVVALGTVYTATRVNVTRFENELRFRGDAHVALERVLRAPAVRAGLRCGPLTLPNHKLVPDSRWIADLPADRVFARADEGTPGATRKDNGLGAKADRGVAIYVTSRFAMFKHALTDPADSPLVEVPKPGFERVAVSRYYAAYVRC
jgi:hypothetical protein